MRITIVSSRAEQSGIVCALHDDSIAARVRSRHREAEFTPGGIAEGR